MQFAFLDIEGTYHQMLRNSRQKGKLRSSIENMLDLVPVVTEPEPCHLAVVFRRHDDPDSEDHHEGERNIGTSGDQMITASVSQSSEQQTDKAEGGITEDEPDCYILEMVEPVSMISETGYTGNVKTSEEDLLVEAMFSETEDRIVTEEKLGRFEREVIEVNSDDEDNYDENMFVKKEESTEENAKEQTYEGKKQIEPLEEFDERQFNSLELPDVEILKVLDNDVKQNQDSSEKIKEKFNRGKFHKNKENRLDLSKAQEREVLRSPFIEEQAYKIFINKDIPRPERFAILGAHAFKTENGKKTEYKIVLRQNKITDQQNLKEQRQFHITVIMNVNTLGFHRVYIPEFTVYRSNNKKYKFSEADFCELCLKEIIYVYNWLSMMKERSLKEQIAIEAVKRFMRESIKLAALEDFQLGLESMRRNVNLTLPNQKIARLEERPLLQLGREPEEGFVFINSKYEKIYIRSEELNKYSDGTLKLALKYLKIRLHIAELTAEQKKIIESIILKIQRRLVFRIHIRQYEIQHGVRKRSFFRGAAYVPGFRYVNSHFPPTRPPGADYDPTGPVLPKYKP